LPGIAESVPSIDLPVPRVALAIGAHPDDVEFGCGGTLAKWAAAGCSIHHLICTDGSKGTWDPAVDPAELVALRREEQRAAARKLGGSGEAIFLGWPDGELESGVRQRMQVAAWIRRLKPDVLLAHDPWKRYRLHPDHRNAGLLATDGIVAARDPLFFPELDAPPHRPEVLLLFEPDEVDHYETVDATFDTKIAALLEHSSQFETTMYIDSSDGLAATTAAFVERERDRLERAGADAGLTLAEPFKRMDRL
jgi:LmbE family N-acetylglucosaminyl deacetylase